MQTIILINIICFVFMSPTLYMLDFIHGNESKNYIFVIKEHEIVLLIEG